MGKTSVKSRQQSCLPWQLDPCLSLSVTRNTCQPTTQASSLNKTLNNWTSLTQQVHTTKAFNTGVSHILRATSLLFYTLPELDRQPHPLNYERTDGAALLSVLYYLGNIQMWLRMENATTMIYIRSYERNKTIGQTTVGGSGSLQSYRNVLVICHTGSHKERVVIEEKWIHHYKLCPLTRI